MKREGKTQAGSWTITSSAPSMKIQRVLIRRNDISALRER
jgi:hypothetical protein